MKYKRIWTPACLLSFYYHQIPEQEAFYKIIKTLGEVGATWLGHGSITQGKGIRDKPFSTERSITNIRRVDFELKDIDKFLNDPNIRLITVYFENAIGTKPKTEEYVTYGDISEEAMLVDQHPIEIWGDCTILYAGEDWKFRRANRTSESRFLDIIKATNPAYATFTVEEQLKCPTDLRTDTRHYLFWKFFVNGDFVGVNNLNKIGDLYQSSEIIEVNNGLYINYQNTNPPRTFEQESIIHEQVKRMLAYTWPNSPLTFTRDSPTP